MTTSTVSVRFTGSASDLLGMFEDTASGADETAKSISGTFAEAAARMSETMSAASDKIKAALAETASGDLSAEELQAKFTELGATIDGSITDAMATFSKEVEEGTAKASASVGAFRDKYSSAMLQLDAANKAAADGATAEEDVSKGFEKASNTAGGLFGKLGNLTSSIPIVGESFKTMGEKMAEAESSGQKFSAVMQDIGKVAVVSGLAIGGVAAAEGIHLAEAYQQSTASLAAHADISVQAAQKIGNAFLSTAGQTTFSAQQMETAFAPVAGQFQTMYGHALTASQSLTFMKAAMDAAEASGAPLADTTKALADAMKVYHLNVGQASTASDAMWNTSRLLGISVTDLGTNLERLEPRIAGSGMSLQQTGAFMVELSKSAGGGRQAMRLAGTAIQAMISPSTSAQKALEQMGVSLTDSSGKFIGMRAAIGELHGAFSKLPGDQAAVAAGEQLVGAQQQLAQLKTETQTSAVKAQVKELTQHVGVLKLQAGQLSQSSAMQAIFGRNANLVASIVAGGVPAFDAATKAVSKQGTAQSAAEVQAKTWHGTVEKLKSTFEDLAVKLGNALIPVLTQLGQVIAGSINFFMQHKTAVLILAAAIGGPLVAAFAMMLPELIATAAASVAAAAPIIAIGAAVGLVGAAIYELATHWSTVWAGIKAVAADVWHALDSVWHSIEASVRAVWGAILDFFKQWWQVIVGVFLGPIGILVGLILHFHTQITSIIEQLWHDVTGFFTQMWSDVSGAVTTGISNVVGFFEKLPGDVMNAVGTLLTDMLNFGENIVHAIVSGIGNVAGDIGHAIESAIPGGGLLGKAAHFLGFSEGGIVPGAVGAPMLAVVHGGETIIPPAVLQGGYTPGPPLPNTGTGAAGGKGPANQTIQVVNYGVAADPTEIANRVAFAVKSLTK